MDKNQIDEIFCRAKDFYYAGKYAEAFAEYEKTAREGHAPSMNMLGYLCEVGKGTEKDLYKAFEWYKKSAQQGNETAQYNLANCYKNGKGTQKDLIEAVKWFTASAEQGNPHAQYALAFRHLNAEGTPQSNDEYIKWITLSAQRGNLNAQFALACDYIEGTAGVDKDLAKAVILLERPAKNGNTKAQLLLGRIYKKGGVVPKDEKSAFELFELSAQKEPEAMYELGLCYYNSIGVKKSYYTAIRYIKEASEAGVEKAKKFIEAESGATEKRRRIASMFPSFTRVLVLKESAEISDLENACALFQEIYEDDDKDSKRMLGKLYYWLALAYYKADKTEGAQQGKTRENELKARENMEKSAMLDCAEAIYMLKRLTEQ